jgi:hypothetical protein
MTTRRTIKPCSTSKLSWYCSAEADPIQPEVEQPLVASDLGTIAVGATPEVDDQDQVGQRAAHAGSCAGVHTCASGPIARRACANRPALERARGRVCGVLAGVSREVTEVFVGGETGSPCPHDLLGPAVAAEMTQQLTGVPAGAGRHGNRQVRTFYARSQHIDLSDDFCAGAVETQAADGDTVDLAIDRTNATAARSSSPRAGSRLSARPARTRCRRSRSHRGSG